jgi:5S rRNA maturation endonuclease (ribonuclease M5)
LDKGPKRLEDNEKKLLELFRKIEGQYSLVIVVEGERDELALRALGITTQIVRIHRGKRRNEIVEQVVDILKEDAEVLILTDFDDEGSELNAYLQKQLEARRIPVEKRLRGKIAKLMRNQRHIEQIVTLLGKQDSPDPQDLSHQ